MIQAFIVSAFVNTWNEIKGNNEECDKKGNKLSVRRRVTDDTMEPCPQSSHMSFSEMSSEREKSSHKGSSDVDINAAMRSATSVHIAKVIYIYLLIYMYYISLLYVLCINTYKFTLFIIYT